MSSPKGFPPPYVKHLQALEEIRGDSHELISAMPHVGLHFTAIDRCLFMLDSLQGGPQPEGDSNTIRGLTRRLANTTMAALSLATEAFYLCSMSLQRDILETGFLLEHLARNRSEIRDWHFSTTEERRARFSPGRVRDVLNADGADRHPTYKALCEYATHPTTKGTLLLMITDAVASAGPHLVPKNLQACIGELSRNVPYFTAVGCRLLLPDIPDLKDAAKEFFAFLRGWVKECYGMDLEDFDESHMAAWARRLWPPEESG
jgi:hypothetical protein